MRQDRTEARRGADQALGFGQIGRLCDQRVDLRLDRGDPGSQRQAQRGNVPCDEGVGFDPEALALGFVHILQAFQPPGEAGETRSGRVRWRVGGKAQRPAHLGQHGGVDPVGLGQPAGGAREIAGPGGR